MKNVILQENFHELTGSGGRAFHAISGSGARLRERKMIKAPFMVAILIGLFFFLTGLSVPGILSKSIGFLANLNTPLAMFTIGIYLAQTDVKKMFFRKKLYLVSFVRLAAAPFLSLLLLSLLPASMQELKLAVLIAAACPVGSNVAVYAQLHDKDYPYAVETVVISTALSVLTIPLLVQLAMSLWGK